MTEQPALPAAHPAAPDTASTTARTPAYAPAGATVGASAAFDAPFPGGRGPAPLTPADETTWATVGHLSWLAGSLVGLPVLGPLVLFLVLRDRGPFVRHHTAEALNLQLSLLLYALGVAIVGGIVTLVTFGFFAPVWAVLGGVLVVAGVVLTVLAAIASARGEWYRIPASIRFVR